MVVMHTYVDEHICVQVLYFFFAVRTRMGLAVFNGCNIFDYYCFELTTSMPNLF